MSVGLDKFATRITTIAFDVVNLDMNEERKLAQMAVGPGPV